MRPAFPMPILFMLLVSPSTHANAQASLEKCACHVDPTAAESTSGFQQSMQLCAFNKWTLIGTGVR